MANQTARDTREYLYFNVTTDSNKLRDIIPMATTTFSRDLRIPRVPVVHLNEESEVGDPVSWQPTKEDPLQWLLFDIRCGQ